MDRRHFLKSLKVVHKTTPQEMEPAPFLHIRQDLCLVKKGCLCTSCLDRCPQQALSFSGGNLNVTEACDLCGDCLHVCPTQAIQIGGEAMENTPASTSERTPNLTSLSDLLS